jgi:hypothetical protein
VGCLILRETWSTDRSREVHKLSFSQVRVCTHLQTYNEHKTVRCGLDSSASKMGLKAGSIKKDYLDQLIECSAPRRSSSSSSSRKPSSSSSSSSSSSGGSSSNGISYSTRQLSTRSSHFGGYAAGRSITSFFVHSVHHNLPIALIIREWQLLWEQNQCYRVPTQSVTRCSAGGCHHSFFALILAINNNALSTAAVKCKGKR